MTYRNRIMPGTRFNSLTLIEYTRVAHGNWYGLFRCDCGDVRERVIGHVKNGVVKSCPCINKTIKRKHGHASDNGSTKTYEAWSAMKKRCLNPKHASFKDYGARGITVCERWLESFENFLTDMGEAPEGMSLDRRENDKGYSKENCRWATMAQQNSNKRGNTVLEFDGRKATIAEWSATTGIKDCTISERLRHGWSIERTLTTKARAYRSKAA